MTTTDWLRAKIGPSPNPAPAERITRPVDRKLEFFARYLKPDMSVLNAYCFDGGSTLSLSTFVPAGSVTGIDPNIENLRRARSRRYVSDGGDISFERCTVSSLPFPDEEFEAVLLDGPLATEQSTERALSEAMRVLIPGGLLGARHTVASSRIFTAESPVISRAMAQQDDMLRDKGGDPDAGLRQPALLRQAGFANLKVTSSTEQASEDDLFAELSKAGFLLDEDHQADDDHLEEAPAIIAFETVVETVCWKPV